tara:strand:+ start:98 stop:265 length:168 start_codon:yes stop_codon:yes gene_type:complete
MRMKRYTKDKLIQQIELWEKRLNSPKWVKSKSRWDIGVAVNHLGKLNEELKRRGE